ncbi:MAG: choice-of-anchor D domain-containing protein [Rubrivivax sp.]|nr:choice-of-anchor D domain-containing protein [Rubrivivax sp.]
MQANLSRRPFRRTALALATAAVLGPWAAGSATAAACTWNPNTGNWGTAGSWSCGAVPGGADSATVGGGKAVTVNSAQSILTLTNGGGINIDAASLTLTAGGSTNNTGGVINIANAAVLNQFGQAIAGGTINTTGTGALVANSTVANFLNNVTLNGTLDMASIANSRQRIVNGATINGAVNISNGGILSLDSASTTGGAQTLGGNATINLNDAGARLALDGAGVTTLGANVVVRGQGSIGQPINVGGNNTLVNQGLISADVNGGTLSITPLGGSGSVVNQGTLRATNGATLMLSTGIGNAAGQILAQNGSAVRQSSVTISGGTIATSGTGTFQAISSASNFLDGVSLSGTLDLTTIINSRERIINGATINGAVNVGNGGILSLDSAVTSGGAQTLGGTAVINLNDAAARLAIEGNGSTTLGSGITVRGQGNIGAAANVGGTNVLTNNGLISADVGGGTLSITPPAGSGSFINNGILQAVSGGTLLLSTNILANAGSQIIAGAGSAVVQNGVRINGFFSSSGGGNFTAVSSSANFLDGVNFTGTLDLGSIVNARERIANGATINGVVNISNGGILGLDSSATAGGNQTLAGAVVINLNDAGAHLSIDGNGTTTLASGVTVRGQGNIGTAAFVGGTNVLTNNGLISADVAGGTLNITPPAGSGSFINNGTLQAINGARLLLSTNVTANPSGQIIAGAGSSVVQNGVRVNGVINASGTGVFTAISSAANFLDGVNLTGTLDLGSIVNARERIINGATINGAVNISNGGILGLDSAVGAANQTLGGAAVINLNDASARLSVDGNGTTTLGANVVVRGQGNIGTPGFVGGTNTLFNNGTILADGGTLSITNPAGSGSLAGTGTLQTSGGTLNLATTTGSTQGRLVMGGAGSALNLNTQNLTITNDYANAQSGSGNSFIARAGVSGTGKILAGGDAAQAITGAGVTNGNTANATLTIGNLRVGANTVNYQVANTGTTGPSLRGAIQTSVNGANLTDARLSGAGVTASNYNTGAPGSNTGNLGVTFTAAAAGGLAPLAGQVLNLTSNFANIADQKLNLVLAGGAAAYNAATGNTTPNPVTVANQRIGGSNTAALTVSNNAPAGAFSEDLRATFGSNTGNATNTGGSVDNLLAGSSNSGALRVGVDTSAAGARTGTVTLNYQTTGTVGGVSNGLGLAGANAPQTLSVNGNVYQVAAGAIQTAALNFGTVQVGQTVSQILVIRNTATGAAGFVEDLNASFGSSTGTSAGLVSGIGSLSGILAGTNSTAGNGAMTVSVNTGAAGVITGGINVNYATAGAVGGVSNGLGTAAAGSENYGVAGTIQAVGNVINQASPQVNNPTLNLGAVRVGAISPTGNVSVTNLATVEPQAALNASITPTSGPVTAGGNFNLLNPGGTDNTNLVVGLNTAVAGNYSGANAGTATIAFVSDASNVGNCAPNCQLNLAAQTVNVEGKVYTQAVGQVATGTVNFGIVRVGDTVSARNITVNNTAASTALNDTLRADLSGVAGPFSGNGTVSGINAQGSGTLAVGLNTGTAGIFSQSGTVDLSSQNPDMADVAAGAPASVSFLAQVNNLANAVFSLASGAGTLSGGGSHYTLDLGDVFQGSDLSSSLSLANLIAGPADDLTGAFDLTNLAGFVASGWNLVDLEAGETETGLGLQYSALNLGGFSRSITFDANSFNTSQGAFALGRITIDILGDVIQQGGGGNVPEPGTLALLMAAAAAGWMTRKHQAQGRLAA